MTVLVILAVCVAVVAVLWAPFRDRRGTAGAPPDAAPLPTHGRAAERTSAEASELADEKDRLFQALADLRFDFESGKLSREHFEAEDARLRARAAAVLRSLEGGPAASA